MCIRKRAISSAILVTLALGVSSAAHAQYTSIMFTFTDTTTNTDATGTLIATSNGNGSYTASSGSIDITSSNAGFSTAAFNLLPTYSYGSNDNVLYLSGQPLDYNGVTFGNSGYQVNIYQLNPGQYAIQDTNGNYASGSFTLTSAAVPELSSMLGFGSLVAIGSLALLRRRMLARNPA